MISIVVPVYKVEKYLDRCINSLIHQSLDDIEIILVDDGSPDNCPQMCDEWSKKDNRIKVVHKKNGGLSSARNAGLEIAKGEYVGFVDSDDDVDEEMFERMLIVAKENKVDFVMADFLRILQNERAHIDSSDISDGYYDKKKIIEWIYPRLIMAENLEYGPLLSVCRCLYKKDFLNRYNLKFDEEIRWSEDNIFSAFVGYYADSFYYLKGEGLYHYYCNPGTITTGYRNGAWEVYSLMNEKLRNFFGKVTDYNFEKQLQLHLIFYACNCLGQVSASRQSMFEQRKMRLHIMKSKLLQKTMKQFQFPKGWSLGLKVQLWMIKHKCAGLYRVLMG